MPERSASRRFEAATPAAVRAARRFVADQLPPDQRFRSDVGLAVSEMAANAVLHARTPFTVAVSHRRGLLRIEVADDAPAPPRRVDADADADESSSGRGLRIVGALALAWGSTVGAHGKVVWAEFDCP
jgi:anti-sigma regulatory factor (Ser/Thr protein kinase)